VAEASPTLIADTDLDVAAWREDGQVIGLARAGSQRSPELRLLSSAAGSQHLLDVPLGSGSGGPYAAAWDIPRARLLVATQTSSGGVDFWLVMLGQEDQP